MTTFDYASLGDLSKIYPHLNEHSTLPQIMFALGFFNCLTVNQLADRDIISYSQAPLYLATGLLAAANTSKALLHKFDDFRVQIEKLDNMPSGSLTEKAYYIIWLHNIYMDMSIETCTEQDFLFKPYTTPCKYIQYQDPRSSHGVRLELIKISDTIYKNVITWNATSDTYSVEHFHTHQLDFMDYDDLYLELYRDLPSYYLRDNSIADVLKLLSDTHIDIDTVQMGHIWFERWLGDLLSMESTSCLTSLNTPMLDAICTLLTLDLSAVKDRVEVLCNLGLIDTHNMNLYIDSIYEAGKRSLTFKPDDLQLVDFELLE